MDGPVVLPAFDANTLTGVVPPVVERLREKIGPAAQNNHDRRSADQLVNSHDI